MQLLHNRSYDIALLRITSIATLSILIVNIFFPITSFASSEIIDVSDNDCAGAGSSQVRSSLGHFDTGIVSVSGAGTDWGKNSCLGSVIHHFNKYALYVATNYPTGHCPAGSSRQGAYNCGYNLGLFDVRYASSQGAHASTWFLDVEGAGSNFYASHSLNSSFLYGLASSLQTRGASVIGYYSTGPTWQAITGGWDSGNYAWHATGSNGSPPSSVARAACRTNFTGGPVVYYQWIVGGLISGIDYDAPC